MPTTPRSLEQIRSDVTAIARRLGAPIHQLPLFGSADDGGRPHIEVVESNYHHIVTERGQELSRQTTDCYDKLLYWIFRPVTFWLACDYESRHRVKGMDSRRMIFPFQVQLISEVNPAYGQLLQREIEAILEVAPYNDKAHPNPDQMLNQQSTLRWHQRLFRYLYARARRQA